MFTVDQIENLIPVSPKASGQYNLFVKLNDKIGLKLNVDKCMRDDNYDMQTLAALEGLGPDTYGKIDGVTYYDEYNQETVTGYGFFTEIVKVIPLEELDTEENRKKIWKKLAVGGALKELIEGLDKIGFDFCDCHLGNIGWKNGKIVAIDFDNI